MRMSEENLHVLCSYCSDYVLLIAVTIRSLLHCS